MGTAGMTEDPVRLQCILCMAVVRFGAFTPPRVCSLTTHLLPEPFQPTLGVLPLLLALPTAAVQCCAATVRQRPLWMLPLSLALALCKAAAGTVFMPAALILGNSEVRPHACMGCMHAASTAAACERSCGMYGPSKHDLGGGNLCPSQPHLWRKI